MSDRKLSQTISDHYIPWLHKIDEIIGRDARVRIGFHGYSWLIAWAVEELTPREAIADAINRLEADVEVS